MKANSWTQEIADSVVGDIFAHYKRKGLVEKIDGEEYLDIKYAIGALIGSEHAQTPRI
jgi:hypothetical protein